MNTIWVIFAVLFFFLLFFSLIILVGDNFQIKKSSLDWIKTSGIKRFFNFNTLHGYIYLRWQKQYLSLFINKIEPISIKPLRDWWANQYHSKVLTQEQAEQIIIIEENIPYQNLEQVIPYPKARDIVLQSPPEITIFECGCRNARENHCEPTQVCMFIGNPFAEFMHEHHPESSRKISQEEALEILREEHERGHVHNAWFKNATADRFYVICNCCKCCCGGIEMMNKYGTKMVASSGYVAKIEVSECIGCGNCEAICPFEAIRVNSIAEVNWEKCMGCGVCVDQCDQHALSLVRDEKKGIPLDVRILQLSD